MQIYSIFEPARGPARLDDPASVIFLKEGFCWPALFAPWLWLPYHRMWGALAVYLVLSVGIALLGQLLGANEASASIIGFGFGLIVAWEANGLRRWALLRAGFREVAVVAAKNRDLAEARYFTERAPDAPISAPVAPFRMPGMDRARSDTGWGFMAPDARR